MFPDFKNTCLKKFGMNSIPNIFSFSIWDLFQAKTVNHIEKRAYWGVFPKNTGFYWSADEPGLQQRQYGSVRKSNNLDPLLKVMIVLGWIWNVCLAYTYYGDSAAFGKLFWYFCSDLHVFIRFGDELEMFSKVWQVRFDKYLVLYDICLNGFS